MVDNSDKEKYFLGFYGWDKSTRKYISTEEAESILKMYNFLSMINLIETNYDILINNFFDLYNSLSEISIRNNISFSFKPTDNYYDERTVIRRINNLLSSCRLFMDQNLVFLTEYDNTVLESYKEETHKHYDSSFSYRLCEQLRNSMQHRCLPIELQYGKDWSDTIKVQCLNCRKTKEYCNEKVRSKFQGRGIKALRRHWNQEGLRTA